MEVPEWLKPREGKRMRKWWLLLVLCLLPGAGHAENGLYAGIKTGLFYANIPLTDDGRLWAGQLGYHVMPALDVEVEFGHLESDNKFLRGDYVGIYAGTTIGQQLFLRLRGGLLSEDLNYKHTLKDESNTGFSFGVSAGVPVTPRISAVLSYLWMTSEMYSFNLGAAFQF